MLQQSLAQFQTSQRIRELEDEIIAIGEEIDRIPQGCLIGLEAAKSFSRITAGQSVAGRGAEQGAPARRASAQRSTASSRRQRPGAEPGRQALRRAFRSAPPGTVAHARDGGWAHLPRQRHAGRRRPIPLPRRLDRLLTEYRQIDSPHARSASNCRRSFRTRRTTSPTPPQLGGKRRLNAPLEDGRRARGCPISTPWRRSTARIEEERAALASPGPRWRCRRGHERRRNRSGRTGRSTLATNARGANEHRDYLAQVDRLDKERARPRRSARPRDRPRRGTLAQRHPRHPQRAPPIRLFAPRAIPTEKADMLAEVFDTDGLILCEMVDRGVLDNLAAGRPGRSLLLVLLRPRVPLRQPLHPAGPPRSGPPPHRGRRARGVRRGARRGTGHLRGAQSQLLWRGARLVPWRHHGRDRRNRSSSPRATWS